MHLPGCLHLTPVSPASSVKGYPTILAFTPGSRAPQQYQGERSAAALKAWALSLIPNRVATVNKQPQLQARTFRRGLRPGTAIIQHRKEPELPRVRLGCLLHREGWQRSSWKLVWSLSCSARVNLPAVCQAVPHAAVTVCDGEGSGRQGSSLVKRQ